MSIIATARSEADALEQLHKEGRTDGLPVVIPTRERVREMILASGYDGDVSLGDVGPSQDAATIETVAVNAVMAGCLPEHFPVVVAAVRALCDPLFGVTEVQVTTHPVTPLIVVNGPAREQCGLASGFGALGYGHRANATIGRAVRLVMINVGGGRPGVTDMALYGSPAKFTFCVAENEEDSPWEPLHVSLGWKQQQSTVTLIGVEGPHSVVCGFPPDGQTEAAVEAALTLMGSAVGSLGANTTYFERGTIAVIINPMIARMLADAGHTRESLQHELTKRSRHPRRVLRAHNPFLISGGEDEGVLHRDPSTLRIFVAGGGGGYVTVCPAPCMAPNHNPSVTKEIEINQMCEIPANLSAVLN